MNNSCFYSKKWLSLLPLLGMLFLSVFSCKEEWDLDTKDFPEVNTLSQLEMSGPPTNMRVFGEIKGMKDASSSVEEHGHIWSRSTELDLEHFEGRIQQQRTTNGVFSSLMSGLAPGAVYSYRAYAVHEGQSFFGEIRNFIAGSIGPQLSVIDVEVLEKNALASKIRIDCEIAGIPDGLEITDYGIVLLQLSSPDDPSILDLGNGSVYSLGVIPEAAPVVDFSIPITPLLPGYFRTRCYLQVNGATFYGDPENFAIGDFWERREDIPSLVLKSASTVAGEKGFVSFYTRNQVDDGVIACLYAPSFWSYDVQEKWVRYNDGPFLHHPGGTTFAIGEHIYFGMGASYDQSILEGLNDSFYAYNPEEGSLQEEILYIYPDGSPMRAYGVSFTLGDKAYVGLGLSFGQGSQSFTGVADFWEFDPIAASPWTKVDPYPGGPLVGAVAFTVEGKAYVGLGKDNNGNLNQDFWVFDGTSWLGKTSPFPGEGRLNASAMTTFGKGYVGWGTSAASFNLEYCEVFQNAPLTDFWAFDPDEGAAGTWSQKTDFPGLPRAFVTAFTIDKKSFAGLGQRNWDYYPPFSDFYEYYPD